MNYKLIVEVTFEELLKNYAEAVKTELGRDVEVKCVDAPISVGKVQSTEETTVNTPVASPKKTTPKKKTQAKKKKEPEVVSDVEETKPWMNDPEYQKLNDELGEVLDKMDLERNCFTPEYEKLAKIMDEISAKITKLINSYRSEETLARLHEGALEADKLENTVLEDTDDSDTSDDSDSEPEDEEETETKPIIIPERSQDKEIPENEILPWEKELKNPVENKEGVYKLLNPDESNDKTDDDTSDKNESNKDTSNQNKEVKPKSLDEIFPHRNDPSAPGLFSQFAGND